MAGVVINRVTRSEALQLCREAHASGVGMAVFTPNVDHVVQVRDSALLRNAYERADLVIADGAPLMWLARRLGQPLPERIPGVDFFGALCADCAQDGRRIFLLGGRPESTAQAINRLRTEYPELKVVGAYTGPVDPLGENTELRDAIGLAAPDVIGVFLGCPKQEIWVDHNRDLLPAAAYLCLGGTIDFLSGGVKRAPRVVQRLGLEWLYRLGQEPRRLWRRYLVQDLAFVSIALQTWRRHRADSTI